MEAVKEILGVARILLTTRCLRRVTVEKPRFIN